MYSELITGDDILEYTMSVIFRAQEIIGGRVVFIECQDKPQLVQFYIRNGFKAFRQDPDDGLLQMVRLID
jgi:hypothetical protein